MPADERTKSTLHSDAYFTAAPTFDQWICIYTLSVNRPSLFEPQFANTCFVTSPSLPISILKLAHAISGPRFSCRNLVASTAASSVGRETPTYVQDQLSMIRGEALRFGNHCRAPGMDPLSEHDGSTAKTNAHPHTKSFRQGPRQRASML